ncbi:integral membrane protein-like protein [Lophiostoma macrostomum CBS 122681]|uniref:Integral membrane protein-like protein n=1 Tax=Lophiostoma macrostomum CBS 122681 TaxID=1314788 RepID=A0A6A6T4H1_9PLEO|nr:integral membrane protein-like protein [Lophiostoma macrostomum CBS 122681]
MATPDAQEAAARERIIKHMNADHNDSIQRYLEDSEEAHFYQLRNARMTDISQNEMKFQYAGKQAIIPFDPPLKSLREARERLVQMDKDSTQSLGRSDIRITEFIPCYVKLGHFLNFSQCMLTYLLLPRSANFKPGSLLFDHLLYRVPAFANFISAVRLYIVVIMVGIHVVESSLMVKKLRKHGVTPLDRVWWLWVGTAFVEGITSFWRVDELVAKKRQEKEAKKH